MSTTFAVLDRKNETAVKRIHSEPALERIQNFAAESVIHRKSSCACGGGCPSCSKSAGDLRISQPHDAAEIEADAVADRVMRMPAGAETATVSGSGAANMIQRKCAACEEEDDETLQRKPLSSGGGNSSRNPDHVNDVIGSGGQPLDRATRGFFEPRLGYDLSNVRVHTGPSALRSAREVDARAYTLGNDIVFGSGEYDPESEGGKRLLAHELAHVAQQSQSGKKSTLHRTLKIDTAASDDPATASSMIAPLITGLCPDFEINSTDFVVPKAGTPCSIPRFAAVRASSNPLGCCCLCTLTRPWGPLWRIVVSSTEAPTTDSSSHEVRMTPTSGPNSPELRFWTGGAPQAIAAQPAVEAFGHELCGHAALIKIRAHPTHAGDTDRSYSDIHDPTVRVQNALATEMGLPAPRRGLAGSGSHRGESLRVFTIGPFPANTVDVTPFATQIAAAAGFLNGSPRLLFDTVGFRDATDTTASVSATRAANVKTAIDAIVTDPTITVETTPRVPEVLTRSQPATDGGAGASRVVEVRMVIRPAGLILPSGAAPPATPVHVDEEMPGRVAFLRGAPGSTRGGVNECHKLLAETGWP